MRWPPRKTRPAEPRRPLWLPVLTCLVTVLLVACGVTAESGPTAIDIDVAPTMEVPPVSPPPDGPAVALYLVADHGIVAVDRVVPSTGAPDDVLSSLVAGPTAADAALGFRSSIPSGTRLLATSLRRGTVTVDLSNEFAAVGGEEEILAVAQIVVTLTSQPGTDSVSFLLEGTPIAVPAPDGALTGEPVTFDDYAPLVSTG